ADGFPKGPKCLLCTGPTSREQPVSEHDGIDGAGAGTADGDVVQTALVEQTIEDAPGEGTVRTAALQCQIDRYHVHHASSLGQSGVYSMGQHDHGPPEKGRGHLAKRVCKVSVDVRLSVTRDHALHPVMQGGVAPARQAELEVGNAVVVDLARATEESNLTPSEARRRRVDQRRFPAL